MRLNLRFAFSSIAIPDDNLENLNIWRIYSQVDLTEYVEKHEFVFDAVLDEDVSNDEVRTYCKFFAISCSIYIYSQSCFYPTNRFIVKQWSLWFLQFLIEQKQLVLLMDKLVHVQSSLDPISTEHLILFEFELIFSTQVVERRIPCVPFHLRLPKIY